MGDTLEFPRGGVILKPHTRNRDGDQAVALSSLDRCIITCVLSDVQYDRKLGCATVFKCFEAPLTGYAVAKAYDLDGGVAPIAFR